MGGKGKRKRPSPRNLVHTRVSPASTTPFLTSVPGVGGWKKRKHVFCYFCLFFIREIIETRASSPGPHCSGLQGEHTSLWFFIFLRSHHLSNREFLCAEARLPSGGHLGELQLGEAVGIVKRTPPSPLQPGFQRHSHGLGARPYPEVPERRRGRASIPPALCQLGYGPQCIPVQSPTLLNKNGFFFGKYLCLCI